MKSRGRTEEPELLEKLRTSLRHHGADEARIVFVLGSGLGVFAERLHGSRSIPYAAIDGMPESRVPGHAGKLVIGEIAGLVVVAQQGRVHLYEGHSVQAVTRAIRALVSIGCAGVVLTNAAGGLRAAWEPGTLMRIRDHLNLQSATPLTAERAGRASPYDHECGDALERGAVEAGVPLRSGVYAALPGPSYETPAEIRMLAWAGADAVGMSTACEALAARATGARVTAVSCITNLAAGISGQPLSHAEVMSVGRRASQDFCALLECATPHLAGTLAV